MKGRRKGNLSARSESYRARRKTADPILPTVAVERTQTEAGTHALTRGRTKTKHGPIPSKTAFWKIPRRGGAYRRKERPRTPRSCGRKALSLRNGRIPNFPSWTGNGYPMTPPSVLRSRTAPSRIDRRFRHAFGFPDLSAEV